MNRRTRFLTTTITGLFLATTSIAVIAQELPTHNILNTPHSRVSDDEQIKLSDKYKSIADDYIANNDYYNAKYYLHKSISALQTTDGGCINIKRVFTLKQTCQKVQSFINYAEWGYKHSKHQSMNIWPALADQLRYFKVPGFENITAKQLLQTIIHSSDHKMLNKEVYFSIWGRIFNDDGIDYAIDDHMGVYHATIIDYIEMLAVTAHVLNVNIVVLSQDTNAPIVIKQKNAIATLYIGFNLQFENIQKDGPVRVDSAYRDKNTVPGKSMSELIDNTPYSYE